MIQDVLTGAATFIGIIWCVFIVSRFVPKLNRYGVVPAHRLGWQGFRPCHSCITT